MTHFKTLTMISAAAALCVSAPVFAQDTDMIKDKAVDMAKDKVKTKAKTMASEKAGDMAGEAAGKGVDMGADMIKGKSMGEAAKGAVMDSGKSSMKSEMGMDSGIAGAVMGSGAASGMAGKAVGSMSTDEKIKAGTVIMKGGSAEDAAMAVAKDRAKTQLIDEAKGMMVKDTVTTDVTMPTAPGPVAAPVMAAPAPTQVTVNCPAGTTAQDNGTCMITGDYKGK